MLTARFLGAELPDPGPLFLAVLGVHVLAGITSVIAGVLAATARKRRGRHPTAGRIYLWGLAVVFVTAAVMSAVRWRQDAHLFVIATLALGASLLGWRARRRQRPGWPRWHAWGMSISLTALFTGFYVDNGSRLPLWDHLPQWSFWVIPAAAGIPLIFVALHRFRAGVSAPPPATGPSAGPPIRRR